MKSKKTDRLDKRAAALRDNLKKRKAAVKAKNGKNSGQPEDKEKTS